MGHEHGHRQMTHAHAHEHIAAAVADLQSDILQQRDTIACMTRDIDRLRTTTRRLRLVLKHHRETDGEIVCELAAIRRDLAGMGELLGAVVGAVTD